MCILYVNCKLLILVMKAASNTVQVQVKECVTSKTGLTKVNEDAQEKSNQVSTTATTAVVCYFLIYAFF